MVGTTMIVGRQLLLMATVCLIVTGCDRSKDDKRSIHENRSDIPTIARKRVVRVAIVSDNSQAGCSSNMQGTGVILGRLADDPEMLAILTSFHVVQQVASTPECHSVTVQTAPFGEASWSRPAKLGSYDEVRDLAIVEIPCGEFSGDRLPVPTPGPTPIEMDRAYAGLLWEMPVPVATSARIEGVAERYTTIPTGRVRPFEKLLGPEMESSTHWLIDFKPEPGMSGSPVLNEKGLLVGLIYGWRGDKGAVVHVSELSAFLQTSGYSEFLSD